MQNELEGICHLLATPIDDVNIVSRMMPSKHGGITCETSPAERTFVCISCNSLPAKTVVFFLGEKEDRIESRIICNDASDMGWLCELVHSGDPYCEGLCMTGIAQLLNPVFNFGTGYITNVTFIVANLPLGEGVVGVFFGFPFGVRFGLQIFDDHRLSICFNDLCDVIVSQARQNDRIKVIERWLSTDKKPHFSDFNWFDWLSKKHEHGESP